MIHKEEQMNVRIHHALDSLIAFANGDLLMKPNAWIMPRCEAVSA